MRCGAIEFCVLAPLRDEDCYGLELTRVLAAADGLVVSAGTVYLLGRRPNTYSADVAVMPIDSAERPCAAVIVVRHRHNERRDGGDVVAAFRDEQPPRGSVLSGPISGKAAADHANVVTVVGRELAQFGGGAASASGSHSSRLCAQGLSFSA
jgi:hypothetical protein